MFKHYFIIFFLICQVLYAAPKDNQLPRISRPSSEETLPEEESLDPKYYHRITIEDLDVRNLLEKPSADTNNPFILDPIGEAIEEEQLINRMAPNQRDQYWRAKYAKRREMLNKKMISELKRFHAASSSNLNVEEKERIKVTAFSLADKGNITELRPILQQINNINIEDQYQQNLLMHAIINKQMDMAKYLITQKINIQHVDQDGKNALHYAVIRDQEILCRILLQSGVDRNVIDKSGKKPLDYASNAVLKDLLASQ